MRAQPVLERLMEKVVTNGDGDCWTFEAGRDADGYGRINSGGRSRKAHAVAYEELVGPIPDGFELDHTCSQRACCNPDHLEIVTHAENVRRGRSAAVNAARQRAKTHCPKGHPYAGANLYINPTNGQRVCKRCNNERARARRA